MKASTILFKAAEAIDSGKYTWVTLTLWDAVENKGCALGIINRIGAKKSLYAPTGYADHMKYIPVLSADVAEVWNGAYEAVHALACQLRTERRITAEDVNNFADDNQIVYTWNDCQRDKRVISRKFRKVARLLRKEGK